jgi:hypothetical protein
MISLRPQKKAEEGRKKGLTIERRSGILSKLSARRGAAGKGLRKKVGSSEKKELTNDIGFRIIKPVPLRAACTL